MLPSGSRVTLPHLILAAALIAALAFFVAPWFALSAVRSAAESEDQPAISELVDIGLVRQGLRSELAEVPAPAPVDPWRHPLEAMRQALAARTPAGPSVDSYLTPAALNALINGRLPGQPVTRHPWPSLRYWGFDRCRLSVADGADARRVTILTFQRRGWYTWRLTQIHLPQ
jgi:hypothetical protein